MFTGIVECTAIVNDIVPDGTNIHFVLESRISPELRIDQSVAHNGACLTVVETSGNTHKVTAVAETLAKTNLGTWQQGYEINLERSLRVGDRLDGHFVQGHVDCTAECIEVSAEGEGNMNSKSWLFRFRYPREFSELIIEKGSICLNGVSLTVFNVKDDEFTVAIIPYTWEHTNFHTIVPGCRLNVEFDVLGKYLQRRRS
jgi:riboflavin synthase